MPDSTSLQDLVLGYCQQVGGLVEPPAYGIYEVLLPDEAAARWGIGPHQRFIFSGEAEKESGGATFLHYGHPLVETIVKELCLQSANGQFYINPARLEKPGLYAVVEKELTFTNAKLFPVPGAVEKPRRHHYLCFNFKVSLLSDEKRELILPLWMDLQAGYAANGTEISRQAILDVEDQLQPIEMAAPFWMEGTPLSAPVLDAMLERARTSSVRAMGDTLAGLQKRLSRFLELDRARLDEYYSDLLKDAERRLQKAEEERRPAQEAKLAAIAAERQLKLDDVEQKYRLHVQLELLNLAVIVQPKLDFVVEIRKRTVSVKRQVTWDPLLHAVEPPGCDVCGQPAMSLALCENGHLVHPECLAPQCVECKRTYCQKCADQVKTCAVCDHPVCVHSLVHCSTCGRDTCHDHINECHADNGQPRRVSSAEKPPIPETASLPSKKPQPVEPKASTKRAAQKEKAPLTKPVPVKRATPDAVSGDSMEIYIYTGEARIDAVIGRKGRELAKRDWEMSPNGIAVHCVCEKGPACKETNLVYRPAEADSIEGQIQYFLDKFQQEYNVPAKKVRCYQFRQGESYPVAGFKLPVHWKNPAILALARTGFEKLR